MKKLILAILCILGSVWGPNFICVEDSSNNPLGQFKLPKNALASLGNAVFSCVQPSYPVKLRFENHPAMYANAQYRIDCNELERLV